MSSQPHYKRGLLYALVITLLFGLFAAGVLSLIVVAG